MIRFGLCFVLVLLQINSAWAQIAIRTQAVSHTEFRAVLATHPELQAFSESLSDSALELTLAKDRLNRSLELAQRAFLEDSIGTARQQFIEIGEMAHVADWPLLQRRAIHYALLRCAQLTDSPQERRQFLERAIALDSQLRPDAKLFPPPLLLEFETTRTEMNARTIEIRVRERFVGFEVLKLNGREYKVSETTSLRVFPGTHRLHLRSDVMAPITEILSASKILIYSAPEVPLSAGSCANPSLSKAVPAIAAAEALVVVYSSDCLSKFHQGSWSRVDLTAPEPSSLSLARVPKIPDGLELREIHPPSRPLYKRGWFWAGLAGAAILIASRQPKKKDPVPSTTVTPSQAEGF